MIEKTTVLVICINKGVKSIVFRNVHKICDESGLTILNSLFPDRTREGLFGV